MKKPGNARLVTWIVGCTLLAFAVFNAANYHLLSAAYHERIVAENSLHAQTVAASVSEFFETAYRVVEEMSLSREIRGTDGLQQTEYLRDRFARYGFFDNLVVQRAPDGLRTAQVRGAAATLPDRWWFRRIVQEKRPFISPSFYSFGFDGISPVTVVGIVFPVARDETVTGVLAAFLRLEELLDTVTGHYRDDDRYTYILDEDGTVVAHPEWSVVREHHNFRTGQKTTVVLGTDGKPRFSGQDYLQQQQDIALPDGLKQAVIRALDGYSGSTEIVDRDGNILLCSYEPVRMPGYGASWAAITVQDKSVAMAPLQKAATANAALSFLVFAGLAALLLRQSREVEKGAQALSESNIALAAEVAERTKAEVELTAANEELTAMNEEMLAVTDELQQLNQQMSAEIDVRRSAESRLRMWDGQYRAMIRLLADNSHDVELQMEMVLDSALQMVGAKNGYVVLLDKGQPMIRYSRGIHAVLKGTRLDLSAGLFPLVLATGQFQYVEDYQSFPERRRESVWSRQSTTVMFPLKKEGRIIGGLTLAWQDERHPLSTDELEMLQQFAELTSLGLQAAEMREGLRRELLQQTLLHDKIAHLAYHDVLTGLPNRASLGERLTAELQAAAEGRAEGVMLFIDLDDLKSINDNFGHPAGDGMIVDASWKIRHTVGREAFVARLGGDEFVVIMRTGKTKEIIGEIAEELVKQLGQEYPVAGKRIHVSASVGIAAYPSDGISADELMKKADNAMYAAKAAGRNCWRFYEPSMLQEAQDKLLLTNSLRHALERQEFYLVYQPQVRIADGRVVGFEALVRWHSTDHGMVAPSRFIPLAEQSRLIVHIGEWVLHEACSFAKRLTDLGYPQLRMAVNLSPKQLADKQLLPVVRRCIRQAGIDPGRLELEITETALLTSMEESGRNLASLSELGVGISLDDFGTGYSSLTYLRIFPVGILKIDKSFIDNLPNSQEVMVRSLIQFAKNLKLRVIAEGVETQAQWDYLADCGCDMVQGYLISRPLSPEAAERFLLERNSG